MANTDGSTASTDSDLSDQPNVLLIVIDACRADFLSPYAPGTDRTPALESFHDRATTFKRAISPAPWTLPSVTSLLTGRYPFEHRATSRGFRTRARTIVDDLSAVGYRCVHLSPTTWIGEWLPQGRGFDRTIEYTGPIHRFFDAGADVRELSSGVSRGRHWYTTVVKRALRSSAPARSLGNALAFKLAEATRDVWRDDVRASETAAETAAEQFAHAGTDDRPFFLYVHLMDPHLPYYPPEPYRTDTRPPGCTTQADEDTYMQQLVEDVWSIRLGERELSAEERAFLRTRYADEVAYADSVVGTILRRLDAHGLEDETVVAITADHGEHLGAPVGHRTLLGHQTSIRLPVLRVPLIVRYPGVFGRADRDDLVQPHFLAETVRGLAGLEYDRTRSLLPEDTDALRDTAVATYDGVVQSHPPSEYRSESLFKRRATAVYGEWKLDDTGGEERAAHIDWRHNETTPVAPSDLPTVPEERLRPPIARLDSGSEDPEPRDLPAAVEKRLGELGYR